MMNRGPMYYHRDGTPYVGPNDTLDWARDHANREIAIVKQELTPNKLFWVSTVWLGLDHSFSGVIPIIFESMVFCRFPFSLHPCSDIDQDRYASEADALAGHTAMYKQYSEWKYIFLHIKQHFQMQWFYYKLRRRKRGATT